jgi:hypothetical protein
MRQSRFVSFPQVVASREAGFPSGRPVDLGIGLPPGCRWVRDNQDGHTSVAIDLGIAWRGDDREVRYAKPARNPAHDDFDCEIACEEVSRW